MTFRKAFFYSLSIKSIFGMKGTSILKINFLHEIFSLLYSISLSFYFILKLGVIDSLFIIIIIRKNLNDLIEIPE